MKHVLHGDELFLQNTITKVLLWMISQKEFGFMILSVTLLQDVD